MTKKRNTTDDVGFNTQGQPYMLGDQVAAEASLVRLQQENEHLKVLIKDAGQDYHRERDRADEAEASLVRLREQVSQGPGAAWRAATVSEGPRFIVAEVSKNWCAGEEVVPGSGLIAEQFERVVNVNATRGYRLLTFSLHRLMVLPDELNETIVAVFERERLSQ